jgi:hypothetical protein
VVVVVDVVVGPAVVEDDDEVGASVDDVDEVDVVDVVG